MTERKIMSGASLEDMRDYPALISGDRVVSYGQYHQLLAATVDWLQAKGIQKGQRVGIRSDNSIEYVIVLMALIYSGAVACPLNTRVPTERNLEMLKQVGAELLPMPDPFTFKTHNSKLTMPELNQDATIVFTSGSSATPKAALHTFGNHYYSALGSNGNIELRPNDRWLLSLPLYHVGGMGIVFRCLLAGAAVVVPEAGESVKNAVAKYDITHLSLVPAQLRQFLYELPKGKALNSIKAVLVGGGSAPQSLLDDAVSRGLSVRTTYGSTEMASQVTTTGPNDPEEKLSTSGRVLDYRQVKISDDGEILVKGETAFRGYVSRDSLDTPFDNDGWFATGDLGRFDDDGYLVVTGRADNMFISGGENIYPEEIESAMCKLPDIEEAVVVPSPDEKFGQRPVAFVRISEGVRFDAEAVMRFLRERLPGYKIPVRFLNWPEDSTRSGIKPDRRYMTTLAEDLPD